MEHLLIALIIIALLIGLGIWLVQSCPLAMPPIVKWALMALIVVVGTFALIHATGFAI